MTGRSTTRVHPRGRRGRSTPFCPGFPGKTGVVYPLNRATCESLWATTTITQSLISSVDEATGVVNRERRVRVHHARPDVLQPRSLECAILGRRVFRPGL